MLMQPSERQLKPRQYLLKRLDVRPVTFKDKWCYRPSIRNGKPVTQEEWGYIVTLPSISGSRSAILDGLDSHYAILRSKKVSGQFLLQIIPTTTRHEYGITSQQKGVCHTGKKKHPKSKKEQHVWGIQNLQKRPANK